MSQSGSGQAKGQQTSRESVVKTLTQSGVVLNQATVGSNDNVRLSQNNAGTDGPSETAIVEWVCPESYDMIQYFAEKHRTKFVPRAREQFTGSADDDTELSLETNLMPLAGHKRIVDQPYPVVEVYNTTTGDEMDVEDVDYAHNKITLASDPADGDEIKVFPVITEGTIRYQVIDRFNTVVGNVSHFPTLIRQFAYKNQLNRKTQLHLSGRAQIQDTEKLRLLMDSKRQIVWEDEDYPDQYVSSIGQEVEITV